MGQLLLSFLGPFRVTGGDANPIHFSTRNARALLVYLAMHPGQMMERDHLTALLWPHASKEQAQTSLRQTLYRLRRSLEQADPGGNHLTVDATTVGFNPECNYYLDVAEFTQLLDRCRAHVHPRLDGCDECAERMQRAVALYKSGFLTGFGLSGAPGFEEWQTFTQERLHHQFIATLDTLALYHQRRRDYGAAAGHLQQILAAEPWREESHIALMRCYLLAGKRHLALQQYDTLTRILATELNVQPSPEAQTFYAELIQLPAPQQVEHPQPINPYSGLNPFDQAQVAYFFGREGMVANLAAYMMRHPLLLLVGVSGSGKSSLLHAGVLPALASPAGQAVVMSPGEDPFVSLAACVRTLWPSAPATLAADLRGGLCLSTLLEQLPCADPDRALFILVDQLEEIFTHPHHDETAERFFDLLVETVTAQRAPCRVSFLLALRADFLSQLLAHGRFASLIQDHIVALGALSPAEMARAVELPGQMQNVFFEPGLVERLIEDVGNDPGRLPLLQFCLTRLWQKRKNGWITHADYAEIEELSGALNHYADGVLARLDPEQQRLAPRVLLRLVHVQEDVEPSRRLGVRSEFSREEWAVVQTLTNARLLVTDRTGSGEESVTLVHETLIRNWTRLGEWIYADRAFTFWREGLRDGLRLWEKSMRDAGALLRGGLLAEAEVRIGDRWDELSPIERDFIAASLALREQEAAQEARQREEEREQAVALAQALAEARRATARAQSHAHLMAAQLALFQRETDRALTLALAALDPEDPTPEAHLMLADAAYAPGTIRRFVGHEAGVLGADLFPDEARAASCSVDQSLIIWDLATGAAIRRLRGHTGAVHAVQVSPDGRWLLSASADGSLILWDAQGGDILRRMEGHAGAVRTVRIHADGKRAISAGEDKSLILWDLTSGQPLAHLRGHLQPVYSVAISPDGSRALSGDAQGTLIHWDLSSGRILHRMAGYLERGRESNPLTSHYETIWGIAFHQDGQTALSVSRDQTAFLWDLNEGKFLRRYALLKSGLFAVAFHPDGRSVLLGQLDGKMRVLDLESEQSLEFIGHTGRIFTLVCSRDGRRVLTGGADGSLRLWDLHHGAEIRRMDHRGGGYRVAASLDINQEETMGAIAAFTGEIILWDVGSGLPIRTLHGHREMAMGGVKFLPGGRHLLSASGDIFAPIDDFSLRLWDIQSGAEVRRFLGHTDRIWDLALCTDGSAAFSASHDGTLRRWHLQTGESRILTDLSPQAALAVAISPDGGWLILGLGMGKSNNPDYSLRILDSATGQELHRLIGHTEAINDVVISPDGRFAVSASLDRTLRLWEIPSGSHLATLSTVSDVPLRLAFSPDGRFVCEGATKGKALLWDMESRSLVRQFSGHGGNVVEVKFSGDGRRLYAASDEGSVHEWRIDPDLPALQEWIRRHRLVAALDRGP